MNTDFIPDNVDIWILNWKRPSELNQTIREWLNSFNFNIINVMVNHSSIDEKSIDSDLISKVKLWKNVMRNDNSLGPLARSINESYVHTFLSGKKYCICAHDGMNIKPGWDELIKNSNFDLYFAPQGDQIHIITLDGLKKFGWWDERYASNGNHELDYISRALRKCLFEGGKASLVDIHHWEPNLKYTKGTNLSYNDVGLSNYWKRMNLQKTPQLGPKGNYFQNSCDKWQYIKWGCNSPHINGYQTTIKGIIDGPIIKEEIDWYPWLNLNNLTYANTSY
jgi:hypothetical protein